MASQIPPLLESYLSLPPETSQIVLTGILGASTNWLVLRSLYSLLKPAAAAGRTPLPTQRDGATPTGMGEDEDVKVLLGLNLDTLASQGRFYFVDGLSRLFLGAAATGPAAGRGGYAYLESPRVTDIARALSVAVVQLQAARGSAGKIVLVLDQPDVLLAAGDGVTSTALRDVILDLREKVHATAITLAADEPLLSAQTTALEKEHAAFVLSLAHEAEAVLSLRLLDTGTAKDVGGVVRITRGGGSLDRAIEEHEYLYHVGGDGGVKVFERGQ
ncbi:hypothetical protein VP1G_09148 [Cytospora mali]|uniref:Elongator complex protein 6 n=1 Tax=Cytospora mali TaxID=578113 RepID=A0A194VDB4_CYTMA|nr:hypothetical protein VP1G_09148 [Valsa mali var. pyri (nom. inval.)]